MTIPFNTFASGVSAASALTGAEVVPVIQSGSTVRTTTAAIAALANTSTPSSIKDLQYWFDASQINASANGVVPVMANLVPWYEGLTATAVNTSAAAIISATQLNSKNVIYASGSTSFTFPAGLLLGNSTIFLVFNIPAFSANSSAIISGASGSNSLAFGIGPTGNLVLSQPFVANIGVDTTTLSTNTWYQVNATFATALSYAFRVARAASSSGSTSTSILGASNSLLYTPGYSQSYTGLLAELICYGRVLTLTEIQTVETYLHNKWGV